MEALATRVVESTRTTFAAWFRAVALAYAGFAAAAVALVAVARLGTKVGVVALALVLTLATLKLDDAMRAERRRRGGDARIARVVVAVGQLLFAVVLLVVWRVVVHNDALAFLALVTIVFSLGALVAEWRFSIEWMHRRGPVLLGAALLIALLGLFAVPAGMAWFGLLLVGLSVPVAYLGTELYTEDWLRRPARPRWQALAVAGGGVLVVTAAVLTLLGGYLPYVVILLVVLFVLVAATASDSNSAAVVLVIVVALIWSTAPRPADAPDVSPVDGQPAFVALGDSFMSGEGARRFLEGTNTKGVNQCRRAPSAYAERLALDPPAGVPNRVLFLACSGAKARDIYTGAQEQSDNQLARYAAFKAAHPGVVVKFVLVSVGGNDSDFGEVGKTCVGPGDCSEIGQRWLTDLGAVEAKITEAYHQVMAAFPGVPVIAVPYPTPVGDKCSWSTMTADEHRFLTAFGAQLNQVVASTASRVGAYYLAEMEDALVPGKLRICDGSPGKIGVNYLAANPVTGRLADALNPQNWIHNSFHPNGVGHGAMLDAVQRFLRAYPDLVPPAPSKEAPYAVPSLDTVMGAPAVARCGRGSVAYCDLGSGRWALAQVRASLRDLLPLLLLALLGAWLLVIPMIRYTTEHEITTFKLLAKWWGRLRRS